MADDAAATATEIEDSLEARDGNAGFAQGAADALGAEFAALGVPGGIGRAGDQDDQFGGWDGEAVDGLNDARAAFQAAPVFAKPEDGAREAETIEDAFEPGFHDARIADRRSMPITHTMAPARATSRRARPAKGLNRRCQMARISEKANRTENASSRRRKMQKYRSAVTVAPR